MLGAQGRSREIRGGLGVERFGRLLAEAVGGTLMAASAFGGHDRPGQAWIGLDRPGGGRGCNLALTDASQLASARATVATPALRL